MKDWLIDYGVEHSILVATLLILLSVTVLPLQLLVHTGLIYCTIHLLLSFSFSRIYSAVICLFVYQTTPTPPHFVSHCFTLFFALLCFVLCCFASFRFVPFLLSLLVGPTP